MPVTLRCTAALLLTVGLLTAGCSGPAAVGADTGDAKAAAEAKKKKKKDERTYDTPNKALSDDEAAMLIGFCEATIDCYRQSCDDGDLVLRFKRVRVKSQWGKDLQKHFTANTLPVIGRRLRGLVKEEKLDHVNAACSEVVARFD